MSPRKKPADQQGGYSGAAVIYARYSSHNQRDVSIEQQVEKCREFAERNNLLITEVYADRAITGKTDRRPNFQRMMRDAAKRKFQYVVAWKSNRMGRNMLDAMMNDARLRDMGVRCLYTEEDFDDTAAGRFALRNMMNVNQFYSENMAEDVMRGMMDNAKKCMVNGPLPYGYRRGDDGRYEIEPKEAEVVREIFERFYAGDLLVDIGNDLNSRGIKTGAGNLWNKGSFHRILVNERYIGVYEYAGYRVEDGVPAIVRKELFYAVQKKLKTKKNPQGRHRENSDYLLTGKLFCGHCGGFMVGMSGTSKTSAKHYYYDCQTKRKEKTCHKKAVRRDWIEQKIAEATKQYIMQDEVIQWLVDGYDNFLKLHRKDSMLLAAEEDLDGVKKAIKNVMAAIEQGIITPTTKERLVELEDERRRLEATVAIERAALVDIPKDKIQFWLESFREGDVEDKRYQAKLIDSFVQAVYLYDHELRVAFNFTKNRDGVTIPFEEVDGLCPDSTPEGSYKLPNGSGVSMAGGAVFAEAGVPAIGVTCTNPQVTSDCEVYFRICFTDPFQGPALASYAKELGVDTAYTLAMLGSDYDQGLVHYFKEAFEGLGGTVISEDFPEGSANFVSYINNAKSAGAGVIFAPVSINYAQLIIEAAAAQGYEGSLLGSDTWDNNMVAQSTVGKNVNVAVTTFYQEGGNAEFDAGIKEWINANPDAKTNNGGNDMVSAVTVMGYDAYFTALEALKAAGSTDPKAVLEALPSVSYTGVSGLIEFDSAGDAKRDQAYIKAANTQSGEWDFVKIQGVG